MLLTLIDEDILMNNDTIIEPSLTYLNFMKAMSPQNLYTRLSVS